jgi:hypothetical protein
MRSVIFAVTLALSASAGAQDRQGAPERAVAPTNQGPAREAIAIDDQSNVCVSVHVDQRIWPRPLDADSARNFSGILISALRRATEPRGLSSLLSGPRRHPRFVANPDGSNPLCREPEQDVFVDVRYLPRAEGGPYAVEYRIRRGGTLRTGHFTRDLAREIRTGALPSLSITEPVSEAIYEDIRERGSAISRYFAYENGSPSAPR